MSKGDKKQPWLKFYPSDWSGDRKLHMCSIGARGLLVEMMCVMHEAEPYGHLVTDGKSVTSRQIASLAGISIGECGRFLAELESAGVYSRTENKTIYSRRMVRDKEKAEKDRKNGKAGGNPILNGEDNRGVNPKLKAQIPEARIDDGTKTGASLISPEAFEVTDALEKACGFALPEEIPPGWYGCAMWVQKCLSEGWIGGVMIDAARTVALRKKGGFIESFKYLEKPLAQAMAEYKSPLPQVEIRQPEKLTVIANGTTGNVIAASDKLKGIIDSFSGGAREVDDVRGPESPPHVRLLSQR